MSPEAHLKEIIVKNIAEPDGFTNLNEQFEMSEPLNNSFDNCKRAWTHLMALAAAECFYVIWLDQNHAVYK
jgi:hypothetical protein